MSEVEAEEIEEDEVDPKTLRPLKKRDFKEVKKLRKGISRFFRYHSDLISDESWRDIDEKQAGLDSILEDRNSLRADLEKAAANLTNACEAAVPGYRYSALRENLEVLFVAIVLAMAIRAYFGQPSRIPTGSMQPTLNGIIAYPAPEAAKSGAETMTSDDYEMPGFWQRLADKIWYGRSHVEMISDRDGDFASMLGENFSDRNEFNLLPVTTLETRDGQTFRVSGTKSRVAELMNNNLFGLSSTASLKKGDVIARGFVDTGDWVVVDRFTYHWRKPKRGEVFVFTTHDIPGATRDSNGGEQHYIKRIGGVPGDKLEIEPPRLFVNGEPATEFGIQRVMSAEDGYEGYQLDGSAENYTDVPPGKYVALGDNSRGSQDSRSWGFVPRENIVGRAVAVYFPFGHHFGRIR